MWTAAHLDNLLPCCSLHFLLAHLLAHFRRHTHTKSKIGSIKAKTLLVLFSGFFLGQNHSCLCIILGFPLRNLNEHIQFESTCFPILETVSFQIQKSCCLWTKRDTSWETRAQRSHAFLTRKSPYFLLPKWTHFNLSFDLRPPLQVC